MNMILPYRLFSKWPPPIHLRIYMYSSTTMSIFLPLNALSSFGKYALEFTGLFQHNNVSWFTNPMPTPYTIQEGNLETSSIVFLKNTRKSQLIEP